MRVLVDTSVWCLALRRKGLSTNSTVVKPISLLQEDEDVVPIGLILRAFRSDSSFRRVARHLEPFPLIELERRDFIAAASLHRDCASTGVSVSTADCQIATAAIRHDCLLLSADKVFERIARLSALQLA